MCEWVGKWVTDMVRVKYMYLYLSPHLSVLGVSKIQSTCTWTKLIDKYEVLFDKYFSNAKIENYSGEKKHVLRFIQTLWYTEANMFDHFMRQYDHVLYLICQ